ncbi:ABC transporter permease [Dokdonia sinensis]|uniref:ABC transporter permease n=1 Tax=Dokdonia sinensis TaxID=2479847 RepID=A0A3M0G5Q6_9FLAO|nr:ABC transporter permease [Dokdonia sinensis]RMB57123.1 ABC transporter permease [Dokdonia sinensis]
MFKNSLRIALRGLKGNPLFTVLNITSLVVGLLVIYIAIGYLKFENSYDEFHQNSDHLYRVGRTYRAQDYAVVGFGNYSSSVGEEQQKQIAGIKNVAGIENATQFFVTNDTEYLRYNNVQIEQDKILSTNAAAGFVEMFTWELLAGSFDRFKNLRNTVILNETTADKLKGQADLNSLIDEPVTIAGQTFTVAAVIKDVPANSHFDYNIATNVERIDYWGSHMYVQLLPATNPDIVTKGYNAEMLKIDPSLATNKTYKGNFLQKVTDIHLKSNILYELKPPGNANYMYLIGAFGILIILITLFNYANFTLALKTKQSKVIGVRKVLGASSNRIASQFLMEAVILVLVSLPVLLITIFVAVPFFNDFMGVALASNPFSDIGVFAIVLAVALVVGILASLAPAILLSSKNTLSLFKEKLSEKQFERFSMRKYLIVSQFAILIGVTSVSYFMYKQIQFIENKDLGFQKEGILFAYSSPDNIDVFQQQLEAIPEIKKVGNGSSFGIETFNNIRYKLEGLETIYEDSNQFYLDYDAVQAYDLKTTLAPSVFENIEEHTRRTLINRSAATRFAKLKRISTDQLIGTQIITEPDYQNEDGSYGFPFTIDGIYEDINVFSLRESVAPYFITVSDRVRMGGMSIVSYDTNATESTLAKINAAYEKMDNTFPLNIEFLDENFQRLHQTDTKTATLVFVLNGIAIFLASIGIIGITLLLIVGKTKEIGIRKVLGATIPQILKLSVREYVSFVVIALIVSTPLAWWVTQNWLDNFAYRVDIQPLTFIFVGLAVLALAATIVSVVSYRSAAANPVKSLKTE